MKKNLPVTGKEQKYDLHANILSTTDLKGAITYVNPDFIEISGFGEDELLGKNHNIVRHPDMPPAAFHDLWQTIKAGKKWMGIVKNRCKNGDHYWVDAFVTPIIRNGEVVEYQSVRRLPNQEDVARAEALYTGLNAGRPAEALLRASIPIKWKLAGIPLLISLLTSVAVTAWLPALPFALLLAPIALGILGSLSSLVLFAPIHRAVKVADVFVDSTLAVKVFGGRIDEAGILLAALKKSAAETMGVVGRIADASAGLSEESAQLVSAAGKNTAGVAAQHEETDQVATAVNEMSASIQEIAESAQRTQDAAGNANHAAGEGELRVDKAMKSIEMLAKEVIGATESLRRLENDSNAISQILDVIRGIAEQTNLLALNAAIEAARAGEQGRGFAVVADEVRGLANRSREATSEIQALIERLQSTSLEAATVMTKGKEQATDSVSQASLAVDALGAIKSAVRQINDMSTQIATAVNEQSAVAEEINRSVARIREVSESTLTRTKQSEGASRAVSETARQLDALAEQFWAKA